MKRIWVLLGYFFALCSSAGAQSLDLFNIDASGFPVVKAKFRASDQNGIPLQSLSLNDFNITENGIRRTVTRIACPPMQPPPALSSVLTMDISGSMSSGQGGVSNLELAKTAARAWILGLPEGTSECAITAFDDQNFFIQDFTSNKQSLLSALEKLSPNGGTDYHKGLLLPQAGGLEVIKRAKYKRILIFLSDGMPNFPPDEDAIVALANQLQVTVFCVTLGLRMPASLKNIASKTGGEWFENVTTLPEAEATYKKIMSITLEEQPCEIEWKSETECSTKRIVDCTIPAHQIGAKKSYNAPQNSIIALITQPASIISMGAINPGSFKDTNITLIANNSHIQISKITISEPSFSIVDYGGSAPPFLLQNGEKRVLKLRFTPTDSLRIYSKIRIENDKCDPVYSYMSGGFRGEKSPGQQLKVTHPNGREIFIVGSDTAITWEGIPAQNPVRLEFSPDKGLNWLPITVSATELKHMWRVPNIPSDKCLVKVSSFAKDNDRPDWGRLTGGNEEVQSEGRLYYDRMHSVTVDDEGNSYFIGSISSSHIDFGNGNMVIGPKYKNYYFFVAKFGPDGNNLWAKRISSKYDCRYPEPSAIKIDPSGDLYVAGFFDCDITFENGITLTNTSKRKDFELEPHDSFLARFDVNGNLIWAKVIGGVGSETIRSITVDTKGAILVGGSFNSDTLKLDDNKFLTNSSLKGGNTATSDGFLIKYNQNGGVIWTKVAGGTEYQILRAVTTDESDNIYVCGQFSADLDLGEGTKLIYATQGSSGFLAKYDENGGIVWGKKAGESESDYIVDIDADESGHIFFSGRFWKGTSIDFGNGITLNRKDSAGSDTFLGKFNRDGLVEWAQLIPGISDIATDNHGNVLVGGSFKKSLDFGNGVVIQIPTTSDENGYIAKFNDVGQAQLAKKITGQEYANVASISCDDEGDVYLGGHLKGNSINFNNGTILTKSYPYALFLAKYSISDEIDMSDSSDAVFSIVKPLATSHNIDMGRVLVSASKDSLIQSFISNTGSWPIRIDAINIAGTNATDFQLVSGIPPFTIPVGDKKAVEFRFRPTAVGGRSADLAVITQADTLHQSIIGEGVRPVIQVTASLIDFGIMEVGSLKDTTVTAVLKNIGDVPLAITNTQMLGPDKEQFEIISGGGSFTLASGATQTMQLRFSPKYIGRTSGQIGFDYDGMAGGRPAVVQLFGQGIGGNVYVVDDSAYIGETRDIQLMLGKVKPASVAQTAATSFRATLAFKNSILTPASAVLLNNAVFKKGTDTDTLSITQQWSAQTSELARIPFIATLGDRLSTDIELLEFDWLDDSGSRIDYDTELQSGVFTVLGICPEGGDRLFDAEGEAQMMLVTPNPVNTTAEIRFKTIEKGHTLITLTDVLGRQIELVSGDYSSGEHSVEIPAGTLTQGIYFLTMQTPTQVFTQRVVVEK